MASLERTIDFFPVMATVKETSLEMEADRYFSGNKNFHRKKEPGVVSTDAQSNFGPLITEDK